MRFASAYDIDLHVADRRPPIANAGGSRSTTPGDQLAFDAGAAIDADGNTLRFHWDFGDDTTAEGAKASHGYANPGTYTVTLTADDGKGAQNSVAVDRASIFVNAAPVADAVRSILDGHVVLSRDLASRHHYPPIDILQSVSRTMPDVTNVTHRQKAGHVREWMAAIRDSEDLVSVGAYVAGSNPRIDQARAKRAAIDAFLCQDAGSLCSFTDAVAAV